MLDEPTLINCRVALRLCAAILFDRARELEQRTARASAGQIAGRKKLAAQYRQPAESLQILSRQKVVPGEGVDAAILGYLLALLGGESDVLTDLRAECLEIYESDVFASWDSRDMVSLVRRAIQS